MHKIKMNMITKSGKIWQDAIEFKTKKEKDAAVENTKMLEECLTKEMGKPNSTITFKFGHTQVCVSDIAVISFLY